MYKLFTPPAHKISIKSKPIRFILNHIQHYNHDKYWYRRSIVVNANNNVCFMKKLLYLYYIKRCDAFNNASFGTNINSGSTFKTPPILLHGMNGIVVGHDITIGENVTICQQVTIMHGGNTVIGNNVFIGAGAKILPGVHIGHNVKIGANCVVVEDIPDNATVVLPKPRIILRNTK